MDLMSGGNRSNAKPDYTGLQVQTAVATLPVPIGYGVYKIAPNLIWYADFQAHGQSQGGKGGGPSITSYSYSASLIMALCEGPIAQIARIWRGKDVYTLAGVSPGLLPGAIQGYLAQMQAAGATVAGTLPFSLFTGATPQAVWGYLTSAHIDQALAYNGTAYLAAANYDLGGSPSVDNHNFEVMGPLWGTGANGLDADPALVIQDFLTNPQYGAGLPSSALDLSTLLTPTGSTGDTSLQTYCRALGLCFSPLLNSTETGIAVLQRWMKLLNCAAVWSGGALKFIPYGDTTIAANGVAYLPDVTPVYDLTDDDFVGDSGADPIEITRSDVADAKNVVRVEICDRTNAYNTTPVEARDETQVNLHGLRVDTGVEAHEICDQSVAATVAQLVLQRGLYIRRNFSFKLSWEYCLLEPMDIVTLTDTALGLSKTPVRITEIEEDDQGLLTITAEEFPAGIAHATLYPKQSNSPALLNYAAPPASVNAPVIFEPQTSLTGGDAEIWVGVSGGNGGVADPLWGGCNIWVSPDNTKWEQLGTVDRPARLGILSAALGGSASNPDNTNTLGVDMTESAGMISDATLADAETGRTLIWVDGEIMAYARATLTSAGHYNLTGLVRGLYGTTAGAHAAGSSFLRLDDKIFKDALPAQYVGQSLYLKFQSFNIWGGGLQDLSDCALYTYGVAGTGYQTPTAAGLLTVNDVIPSPPAGFTATGGETVIVLAWSKSPEAGVKGYRVFGLMGHDYVFGDAALLADVTATTWTHANLGYGVSWNYWVEAYTAAGSSNPTGPAFATTTYTIPVDAIGAAAISGSMLAPDLVSKIALLSGDLTNLVGNPNFATNNSGWANAPASPIRHLTTDPGVPGGCSIPTCGLVQQRDTLYYGQHNQGSAAVPVTPGDLHYVSVLAACDAATAEAFNAGLIVWLSDGSETWVSLGGLNPTQNWTRISGYVQLPSNAVYALFWMQINGTGGSDGIIPGQNWYVTQCTWRPASSVVGAIAQITTEAEARIAADTAEVNAREAGDSALLASIVSLTSTVGTNTAGIGAEATTRANADLAISNSLTSLYSTVGTNTAGIASEANARADADTAIANTVTVLQSAYIATDLTNIVRNPVFATDTNGWSGSFEQHASTDSDVPAGCPSGTCAKINSRDNLYVTNSLVTPGDLHYVSLLVATPEVGATQITIGLQVYSLTTTIGWYAVASQAAISGWTLISGYVTIPAGAHHANLWVQIDMANGVNDDANRWYVTLATWRPASAVTGAFAGITSEASTRAAADSVLSSSLTTLYSSLTSGLSTATASIGTEAGTRADADSALSSSLTTLGSSLTSGLSTVSGAITTEATTRADADSALNTSIGNVYSSYSAGYASLSAAISSEASTRAAVDGSQASSITDIQAQYKSTIGNVVLNPIFMNDTSGWTGNITRVLASNSDVPTGCPAATCAKLLDRDHYYSGNRIAVTPGDVHAVSIWVATPSSTAVQIAPGLHFLDANYNTVTWIGAPSEFLASSAWTQISFNCTVPSGAVYAEFFIIPDCTPGTTDPANRWYVTQAQWNPPSGAPAMAAIATAANVVAGPNGVTSTYTLQVETLSNGKFAVAGVGFLAGPNGQSEIDFVANKFVIADVDNHGNLVSVAPFLVQNGNVYVQALYAGTIAANQITSGTITAGQITIQPANSSSGLTVYNQAGVKILDSAVGLWPGAASQLYTVTGPDLYQDGTPEETLCSLSGYITGTALVFCSTYTDQAYYIPSDSEGATDATAQIGLYIDGVLVEINTALAGSTLVIQNLVSSGHHMIELRTFLLDLTLFYHKPTITYIDFKA